VAKTLPKLVKDVKVVTEEDDAVTWEQYFSILKINLKVKLTEAAIAALSLYKGVCRRGSLACDRPTD
jgi:hypothetical protein